MQDSDGANGQVSPNSAMSISPASSEVGSCLVNGTTASASSLNRSSKKPGTKSTTTTKESSNNPSSSQQHNTTSSGSKKLIKGNNSNSARNTNSSRINQQQQPVVDRSDLDLNWRQSKVSSSNTTTKTLSADEDPNWRDHKTHLNSKTSLAKMSKSKHSNNELGTYYTLFAPEIFKRMCNFKWVYLA